MRDILQTANGDVDLTAHDLQMASEWEATDRHKADIILSSKGDFKESPLVGVGSIEYLNSELPTLYLRDVSIAMQRDGIKVNEVRFDAQGCIVIDGKYENNSRK